MKLSLGALQVEVYPDSTCIRYTTELATETHQTAWSFPCQSKPIKKLEVKLGRLTHNP